MHFLEIMKKPLENDIRQSALRAIIGTISPHVVALAISWKRHCLHLIACMDSMSDDDDEEKLSDIAGEMIYDFPDYFRTTKEDVARYTTRALTN